MVDVVAACAAPASRSMSVVASMRTDGNSTSPARHSSTRSRLEPELVAVPRERALDVGDRQHEVIEPDDVRPMGVGRRVRRQRPARQAEDALADDVALHLGRAAGDRRRPCSRATAAATSRRRARRPRPATAARLAAQVERPRRQCLRHVGPARA